DRNGLEALRPRELHRRRSLPPNGIGEHSHAVQLQEDRRVPEPRRTERRFGRPGPGRERIDGGQAATRRATLTAAKKLGEGRRDRSFLESRRYTSGVPNRAVGVARRSFHPFEPETRCQPAEGMNHTRNDSRDGAFARKRKTCAIMPCS